MKKFYLMAALAVLGIIFAVRVVVAGSAPPPVAPPIVEPPKAPFAKVVAGVGIIEAISENIAVASPLSGVVQAVHVKVGDTVESGTALFSLDDRETQAELGVRKADALLAKAELSEAEEQLALIDKMADPRVVSKELRVTRIAAVAKARASVQRAEAMVRETETTLDRMVIRAPIKGRILQVKIRVGEFAPAQLVTTPLMLIGAVDVLGVRVDVDENDAWRVKEGAPAIAYVRGNTALSAPLKFARFEPYVVPKRSLTGESSERVDTRVLQIIYSLDPSSLPAYVGQLLDVFIEDRGAS